MTTGCGIGIVARHDDYGLWSALCCDCDWHEGPFSSRSAGEKAWTTHAGRLTAPARYETTVTEAA